VSNVRGNLYSVVDFAAFLGAGSVVLSEQSRLVLLGDRYRSAAALLVDRLLGLRNPNELRPRARGTDAAAGASPWLRAEYDDEAGGRWRELDVAELVRHADFLSVAQ
jgi:twitching motility protein PilI